jgi:hypothetical protein
MSPLIEGLRLHFNRLIGAGAFLRDSGFVQPNAQPERGKRRGFYQAPVRRARLALRYAFGG